MLGVLIWSKPEFCTGGIGSKFAGFSTDRSMSFRDMLSFLLVEEVHICIYIYIYIYIHTFICFRNMLGFLLVEEAHIYVMEHATKCKVFY